MTTAPHETVLEKSSSYAENVQQGSEDLAGESKDILHGIQVHRLGGDGDSSTGRDSECSSANVCNGNPDGGFLSHITKGIRRLWYRVELGYVRICPRRRRPLLRHPLNMLALNASVSIFLGLLIVDSGAALTLAGRLAVEALLPPGSALDDFYSEESKEHFLDAQGGTLAAKRVYHLPLLIDGASDPIVTRVHVTDKPCNFLLGGDALEQHQFSKKYGGKNGTQVEVAGTKVKSEQRCGLISLRAQCVRADSSKWEAVAEGKNQFTAVILEVARQNPKSSWCLAPDQSGAGPDILRFNCTAIGAWGSYEISGWRRIPAETIPASSLRFPIRGPGCAVICIKPNSSYTVVNVTDPRAYLTLGEVDPKGEAELILFLSNPHQPVVLYGYSLLQNALPPVPLSTLDPASRAAAELQRSCKLRDCRFCRYMNTFSRHKRRSKSKSKKYGLRLNSNEFGPVSSSSGGFKYGGVFKER